MAEQTIYGPVATHLRFENEHVRVWEMDLAPGQIYGLHRHTLDYLLYILEGGRIAVESPAMTSNRCARPTGHWPDASSSFALN